MLAKYSDAEIREYRALNMIDPLFDGERIDRGFAKLAWITREMMRSADSEATELSDWMPDYMAQFKSAEELEEERINKRVMRQLDKWN